MNESFGALSNLRSVTRRDEEVEKLYETIIRKMDYTERYRIIIKYIIIHTYFHDYYKNIHIIQYISTKTRVIFKLIPQ